MNKNGSRWILTGALCLALWPGATHGQTDALTKDDPCAPPNVRTDVRPNAEGPPTEVTVGIHMVDLTGINDVTQTLTGDFVVAQSWVDARLSHLEGCEISLDDIWSPGLEFMNSGRLVTSRPREVDIAPGGQVNYLQRYYGTLASYHNLRDFPFDRQNIVISLMSFEWSEKDVILIVDEKMTGRRDLFNISDWTIEDVSGAIERHYTSAYDRFLTRYDFHIIAQRITDYYIWKIILPLCLIIAMSWSVFWIDPTQFGTQIGLSATTMLTLIAFIFATTNMVPKIGYFTILDSFIVGSTILVFLALLQSLTTTYLVSKAHVELATRADRICRFAFPIVFVAFAAVVLLR
jgi:hypothetical protein